MQVIYLKPETQRLVTQFHACTGGSTVVTVRFSDWYAARAKALRYAIDNGVTDVLIIVNNVQLFERDRNEGSVQVRAMTQFMFNGMELYLRRLLRRFAHVYVPPSAWLKQLPLSGLRCTPTIPLVAAYRTTALQGVDLRAPFGKILCGMGYDSFTVGDYVHQALGESPLDELGSATTWRNRYEQHIRSLISE